MDTALDTLLTTAGQENARSLCESYYDQSNLANINELAFLIHGYEEKQRSLVSETRYTLESR